MFEAHGISTINPILRIVTKIQVDFSNNTMIENIV